MSIRSLKLLKAMIIVAVCQAATPASATPPTWGSLSLAFVSEPSPDDVWSIRVTAIPAYSGADGELRIAINPEGGRLSRASYQSIWRGGWSAGDTITVLCDYAAPPVGHYDLAAWLVSTNDESESQIGISQMLYVEVTQKRVYASMVGPSAVEYMKVVDELRSRGLSDTTIQGIKRDAPDLAEKLYRAKTRYVLPDTSRGPTGSSTEAATPSVGELELHAILNKPTYVEGEPIELAMYLVNHADVPTAVPTRDVSFDWQPMSVDLKGSHGSSIPYLVSIADPPSPSVELSPGDTLGGVVDLNSVVLNEQGRLLFALPRDQYSLTLSLRYKTSRGEWATTIDTARFSVVRGTKTDAVAHELLLRSYRRVLDSDAMEATLDSVLQSCPGSPVRLSAYLVLLAVNRLSHQAIQSERLVGLIGPAVEEFPNSLLLWKRIWARRSHLNEQDRARLISHLRETVVNSTARLALESDELPIVLRE